MVTLILLYKYKSLILYNRQVQKNLHIFLVDSLCLNSLSLCKMYKLHINRRHLSCHGKCTLLVVLKAAKSVCGSNQNKCIEKKPFKISLSTVKWHKAEFVRNIQLTAWWRGCLFPQNFPVLHVFSFSPPPPKILHLNAALSHYNVQIPPIKSLKFSEAIFHYLNLMLTKTFMTSGITTCKS